MGTLKDKHIRQHGGEWPNFTFPSTPTTTVLIGSDVAPVKAGHGNDSRSSSTTATGPNRPAAPRRRLGSLKAISVPEEANAHAAAAETVASVRISFNAFPSDANEALEPQRRIHKPGRVRLQRTALRNTDRRRAMPVSRQTLSSMAAVRTRARAQDGFTMIIAIGVLFVATLLMVAAFTAANGDIHLSERDATNKQAYYAALAGIQEYEYHLQTQPRLLGELRSAGQHGAGNGDRELQDQPARGGERAEEHEACSTSKPFESMIESTGSAANTFRIESIGYRRQKHAHPNCDVQGHRLPELHLLHQLRGARPRAAGNRRTGRMRSITTPKNAHPHCQNIVFVTGDEVKGPMHTNDAVDICNCAGLRTLRTQSRRCGRIQQGRLPAKAAATTRHSTPRPNAT